MRRYFETLLPKVKKLISVLRIIVAALGSDEFRIVIESIKEFILKFKKKGD